MTLVSGRYTPAHSQAWWSPFQPVLERASRTDASRQERPGPPRARSSRTIETRRYRPYGATDVQHIDSQGDRLVDASRTARAPLRWYGLEVPPAKHVLIVEDDAVIGGLLGR